VIIKGNSIYGDCIIPIGINEIQDNIIGFFGIQWKELSPWQETLSSESLRAKKEYAELCQIIMPLLTELAHSIDRFVQFFDSQNREQPVSKLVLTGGGALWQGIGDFILAMRGAVY